MAIYVIIAGRRWQRDHRMDGSDGVAVSANDGVLTMVNTKGRLYFRVYKKMIPVDIKKDVRNRVN